MDIQNFNSVFVAWLDSLSYYFSQVLKEILILCFPSPCFSENAPQIPVAPPQVSPNTVKRPGPKLFVDSSAAVLPTLRPVPNTQLQGHRMVFSLLGVKVWNEPVQAP